MSTAFFWQAMTAFHTVTTF